MAAARREANVATAELLPMSDDPDDLSDSFDSRSNYNSLFVEHE